MAELADAQDLKSCGWRHSYRFDSGCRHKKHMSCVIALHVLFTNIRRKQNPAMLRILVCLICGYGEIGRRAGFRFQWVIPVQVRVLLSARNQYNPNQIFLIGDGFGLFVFFEKFEDTHFRNGVVKRPESRPRGPRKPKLAKDKEDEHEKHQEL